MTNESTKQMADKQTQFAMTDTINELTIEPTEMAKIEAENAAELTGEELAADSGAFPAEGLAPALASAHSRSNPVIGQTPDFDQIAGADFGSGTEVFDLGADVAGAPSIDENVKAPIEADAHLLHDIGSIPQKMAFKIGEAAEMVGVKQYVLRYWETEFDTLRPRKSSNGQRVYSRKDVETAMMIKKLLYNDRFSIEGARHALRSLKSTVKSVLVEEKTTEKLARSQETIVDAVQSLLGEIRRARASFS